MERRSLLIGCSAFALVVLVLGASFYLYWTAPPDVPIPPAPVPPPGNAYDAYLQVMRKTRDIEASVPGLPDITRKALMRGADASLLRRYVQVYEPIRREYRKHVGKPSVATNAEDINAFMQSAPVFRTWARVESADIRLAFLQADHRRAIDDLRTVLLLAEGIRNGAPLLVYLVSEAMLAIALATFTEGFGKLSADECDQVVQVVREWERQRVPFWAALASEKRLTIAMYHAMYEGNERMVQMFGPSAGKAPRYAGKILNLRSAAREAASLYDQAIAEAKKPWLKRKPTGTARHILNSLHISHLLTPKADKSVVSTARLRLLACSAAVRAFRLRYGRYPRTLAEAGVVDLNADPFTGQGFVYRVSPKGFLLYSIGADGVDDGGKRVPDGKLLDGKGDLSLIRYSAPKGTTTPGTESWLK